MAVIEIAKIVIRRGQENQTGMPQLDSGEFGWAEDTEHLYIGKRIVDGAVDDNNTRILTENDLNNIFSLIAPGSAIASTSTYRYRDNLPDVDFPNIDALYPNASRPYTSIGAKLDQTVSIADFVTGGYLTTGSDITTVTNAVIKDLFYNNVVTNGSMRRQLKIPAGTYYISDVIDLPPYTHLVGDGSSMTTLILTNTSTNMFKTIDSQGNTFEAGMANSKAIQPQNIHIEGMTLKFGTGTTSTQALVSLDNVYCTTVKDVIFEATPTSGLVYETLVSAANTSSGSGINTLAINTVAYPAFSGLDLSSGIYYVTGNNIYADKYAQLISSTVNGNTTTFVTSSSFGTMNFGISISESYSLLQYNSWGVGIQLRGQYGGFASEEGKLSQSTTIVDCKFSNLTTGILGKGTVSRVTVDNNIFTDSLKGISFYYDNTISGTNTGPANGIITHNRFENIIQQAINIGDNNGYPSNHISSYNYFDQCGNDLHLVDTSVTTSAYSVISFTSTGNRSDNDFFNRRVVANADLASPNGGGITPLVPNYYYNSLATGYTSIIDNSSFTVTVTHNTLTNIVSFPLTGRDQYVTVKYQMTSPGILSRKGDLTMNIAPDGTTNLTDNYTYTQELENYDSSTNNMFSVPGSTFDKLIVGGSATALANLVGISGGSSNFYVTGSSVYAGLSAYIVSVSTTGSNYLVVTDSSGPQFDFSNITETWTVLTGATPTFNTITVSTCNYVTLYCDATQLSSDVYLEYQTNIFQ